MVEDVSVRIVFAEDNDLLREALQQFIQAQPDFELVATCRDYNELVCTIDATSPDVVLTDIRMPPTYSDEGIRVANLLRERSPETGVVVLSQFLSPGYAVALLASGAAGRAYLVKDRVANLHELATAIREVARGRSVIDPMVVDALMRAARKEESSLLAGLTQREREVLAAMAEGKNNAAIAASLKLNERAVERHSNSLFSKLGISEEADVNRRVKAVLLFLDEQRE